MFQTFSRTLTPLTDCLPCLALQKWLPAIIAPGHQEMLDQICFYVQQNLLIWNQLEAKPLLEQIHSSAMRDLRQQLSYKMTFKLGFPCNLLFFCYPGMLAFEKRSVLQLLWSWHNITCLTTISINMMKHTLHKLYSWEKMLRCDSNAK